MLIKETYSGIRDSKRHIAYHTAWHLAQHIASAVIERYNLLTMCIGDQSGTTIYIFLNLNGFSWERRTNYNTWRRLTPQCKRTRYMDMQEQGKK